MADLAVSAVNHIDHLFLGNGTRRVQRQLGLTLSSMGSATNKILASAMGFTKILNSSALVEDDNSAVYLTAPSADGTFLLVMADGGSDAPGDVSGDFFITIEGIPG